jgi:hypothetical protein
VSRGDNKHVEYRRTSLQWFRIRQVPAECGIHVSAKVPQEFRMIDDSQDIESPFREWIKHEYVQICIIRYAQSNIYPRTNFDRKNRELTREE